MEKKTAKLVLLYMQLTEAQREEFDRKQSQYRNASGERRKELFEDQRINAGPQGDGCPCCGRG